MAVYDLEEQENIEALKAWWRQYGRLVIAVAVAFVLGVAGIQGWRYYKEQASMKAATAYGELDEALRLGDKEKSKALTEKLTTEFAKSAYGARAALLSAKASFDAGDLKSAEALLRTGVANAPDEPMRALVALRLGAVLLEAKKYDEALNVLAAPHPQPFAPLFADLRGDVLVASGKTEEAKSAYQIALDKLPPSSAYRNLVEVKRDALGVAQ